jgi:hypothetical protein
MTACEPSRKCSASTSRPGSKSFVQSGDTTKPEAKTLPVNKGRHAVEMALRQRFKHEGAAQRQVQVVEANEDFPESRGGHPVRNAGQGLVPFPEARTRGQRPATRPGERGPVQPL